MTDPAELYVQLTSAFRQRSWQQARQLAERLLPLAPGHAGAHYLAGMATLELQQMPAALEYLRKAVLLDPARVEFMVQFAKALTLANRNRDAKVVADRAVTLSPVDPAMLDTLGAIYTQVGDYVAAVTAYRQAVTLAPHHAAYHYNLATALLSAGELATSEAEIEACLALDPHYWRAHLGLAQLRKQTPANNHVARLQAQLSHIGADAADAAALVCLHMALAKEYEDLADYPNAFEHLVRGKTAGANRDYSIRQDEALFTAIAETFPQPRAPAAGCPSEEPIFIIGMPRTGTTLVDRIISSHPDVHSAGELLNFGMSLKHLSGSKTSALIDAATITGAREVDWKQLGEIYLSSTRPGTAHKPRFIDKLPHNFLYAGFIANAFPNAKIICLRRDPMDTCLSNFRQLFPPKSRRFGYSFDLLDTGRYFVLFDRLMGHWRRVFPGRILEMPYETLVNSQESSSRQLLEFCGLPWHDGCLRFEENPNPVATASVVQVREPIYRSAMQRWKNYEPQLSGLRELLRDAGIQLDS
ncbi:sulfotransferase [Rhodanobacter sp. MP7CTX1]|uniref:tetratricopeptide repeat-containing sulfotransferase family protein n=1 Tax=Rhodanobacter sp. MP7CTX1 TaxID=2723084 RepID=UPI00161A1559|nr:sulfotransferase [Rhodanobacter sp. MP7CTX1]MBB6188908.1 tetratricopeptide (TPR) repeat protein [Rhodanobacter sp. MP7CTX1]